MGVEKELKKGIELLKEGKEEGFNILYSYTYPYVYNRAKLVMQDKEDALDLMQETFLQAYKGIHQLEDVNNIYAWLGSITFRQGMKFYKKRKHDKDILVYEEAEGIFDDIVSEDRALCPEDAMELETTAQMVLELIDELPKLQRAAIMAFYFDHMKIEEIAEVFDCSSNTIKSRLYYAKKALKEKIEADSVTPTMLYFVCRAFFQRKRICCQQF